MRSLLVLAVAVLLAAAGCGVMGGTLGGREKCWPSDEPRAPSLWRGILEIDRSGGRLATPEGDVIPLLDGALRATVTPTGGQLLRGDEPVAKAGDDVSLFGGAGADGMLVVCAVEEIHSRA